MSELNKYVKLIVTDIGKLSTDEAKRKYASLSSELIDTLFNSSRKYQDDFKLFFVNKGVAYVVSFYKTWDEILKYLRTTLSVLSHPIEDVTVLQMMDPLNFTPNNYVFKSPFGVKFSVRFHIVDFVDIENIARAKGKEKEVLSICARYSRFCDSTKPNMGNKAEEDIGVGKLPNTEKPAKHSNTSNSICFSFCKNKLPDKLNSSVIYLHTQLGAQLEDDDDWEDCLAEATDFFFNVFVADNGHEHFIGTLQIIDKTNEYNSLRNWIINEKQIDRIEKQYVSIGNTHYYQNIRRQPYHKECFSELRDLPYKLKNYQKSNDDSIKQILRENRNLEKYSRIAHGDPELTNYYFTYHFPKENASGTNMPTIPFIVDQNFQQPPTNVHVLIGANGSGKTTLLRRLAKLALDNKTSQDIGQLIFEKEPQKKPIRGNKKKSLRAERFSNVLYISYSFFDAAWEMKRLVVAHQDNYKYIGLESKDDVEKSQVDLEGLITDFKDTYERVYRDVNKAEQWEATLVTISSNSSFSEFEHFKANNMFKDNGQNIGSIKDCFSRLSAGHKSVMLTLLKLLDLVEENTLVLFDEPEEHLHPPLVSGFIRAISEILVKKNGVGIIATHSPVIVQEVPKKCVWIIRRDGESVDVSHPGIETFGESLGTITNLIFGYEIEDTGFHKLILEAVERSDSYEEALKCFNGELGDEGKSILFSLMKLKAQTND